MKRLRGGVLGMVVAASLALPGEALPAAGEGSGRWFAGVLLHDRGFASDEHEDGLDLSLEVQLAPTDQGWRSWLGPLRPHLGLSLSTAGETSAAYAGLTYEADLGRRAFASAGFGLALHDGPLDTRDPQRCREVSDCGFGSRVLFRGALEVGFRLDAVQAVSLYYDHMSHGGLLASENEGIDHLGLRYSRAF